MSTLPKGWSTGAVKSRAVRSSRTCPGCGLGRGAGVGAGDLALDAAGAKQIFAHARVSLTAEQAAVIAGLTEG